jgi:putative proteasome-type protease
MNASTAISSPGKPCRLAPLGILDSMTFCLGITVEEGLVAIADSRLVAGNETLTAKKTASYQGTGYSFFVLNSGLRSLREKVLLYFEEAFARETSTRERLFKVVNLYARQVRRVAEEDSAALERAELSFNAYSLIGGQMSGDSAHRLFLVYPEGNWVEVGPDTCYQIIGASGFGKPILRLSLTHADSMLYAFKVGLLAFDSTQLCAADVGFPVDVILYQRNSRTLVEHRYEQKDLREISAWWQERIRRTVHELPSEWIEVAFSKLTSGRGGPP